MQVRVYDPERGWCDSGRMRNILTLGRSIAFVGTYGFGMVLRIRLTDKIRDQICAIELMNYGSQRDYMVFRLLWDYQEAIGVQDSGKQRTVDSDFVDSSSRMSPELFSASSYKRV